MEGRLSLLSIMLGMGRQALRKICPAYYGAWMQEEAKKAIGHLYPPGCDNCGDGKWATRFSILLGQSLPVIAWIGHVL